MNVVFITNILTPYRMHFYDLMSAELSKSDDTLKVLVMLKEDHNAYWNYNTYKREYTELIPCHYVGKYGGEFFINTGLKKRIDRNTPDIIVLCGSYWYPSLIYISSVYKNRAKILYWSESNKIKIDRSNKIKKKIREYIRKRQFQKYYGFLYPGDLAKELILDYNKTPSFMFCLPNIVDETKFKNIMPEVDYLTRSKLNLPNDKIVLFCSARLSEEKGLVPFFNEVIKSKLKNKACFVIAGSGPLEKDIRDLATNNGLDIRLLGVINQDDMISYYRSCDMFFLPSYSDPSPLSCVEAIWSKCPILISNRVGNQCEVLQSGENGFIFDPDSTYVDTLDRITELDNLWVENARKKSIDIAEKNFSSIDIVTRLIKEFAAM